MSRFGVSLRLARRDLTRAPGRAVLTLLMVGLPVMAVTAGDVLLRSDKGSFSRAAAVDSLGPQAEALVRALTGRPSEVTQSSDGQSVSSTGSQPELGELTAGQVLAALPPGSQLASIQLGIADITLSDGPGRVRAELADLADPLLAGRYSVTSGRLPRTPGEIAVAPKLVAAGLTVGSLNRDGDGRLLRVVGVLLAGDRGEPSLVGLPTTTSLQKIEFEENQSWLVDSPAPITIEDARELNTLGAAVTSRALLREPPQAISQRYASGFSRVSATTIGLVAIMAVLEIILLAGPAFAVGARRQRRSLAQLTAVGGRPQDSRRVVLLGAALLGVTAAAAGIAAGVGSAALASAAVPALAELGSFAVPTLDLFIIFVVAVLSAGLAALAPARAAVRQNPMTVLTERPDPPRASRLPVLGAVVLLAIGLLSCAKAVRTGDETSVALAAVPTVLGAVLLAPLALLLAARLATRLPFPIRYAVRDVARQRGRTAPAVAAIAAVVAGAVALGVGASSDAAQQRAINAQQAQATELGIISGAGTDPALWQQLAGAVRQAAPGHRVEAISGVTRGDAMGSFQLCPATSPADGCGARQPSGYAGNYDSMLRIGQASLTSIEKQIPEADRSRARQVLTDGGLVAFADQTNNPDQSVQPLRPELVQVRVGTRSVTVPVVVLGAPGPEVPQPVLSVDLAKRLGLTVQTTGLAVSGPIDATTQERIADAIDLRAPASFISVNRPGENSDRGTNVALALLVVVAAVLILSGVLTSTLLVLSDARPQFATLHALGAADRVRRRIAAGYAGTLGLVGAVLGVGAGLVPGIAVAYPLTSASSSDRFPPYLDIPWLLLAVLVLMVPAMAAGVAAITARGPLPSPSRKALA